MAGRSVSRARKEAGYVHLGDAYAEYKRKVYGWLPGLAEATYDLAMGVRAVEEFKDKDGKVIERVYRRPPDLGALIYLTDRAIGKPRVEADPVNDALTVARTNFINTQLSVQWLQAQAREMEARAQRSILETNMWPKQFVTEDEEREHLRELARAANKALVGLTPEVFATIAPGVTDPAASLEALKGLLGREQAEIFEEVMSGAKEVADSDEGNEDYGDE